MPFVTTAKQFLEDPGELAEDKKLDVMYDTVGYLLENAIGLKNAKSTDKIIKFLNKRGYAINRHQWEIEVLGKLRDEGIFIASHKSKGMYIIDTREEAENFYLQYLKRVAKQKYRLEFLKDLIDNGHWESTPITKGNFDVGVSDDTIHVPPSPPPPPPPSPKKSKRK